MLLISTVAIVILFLLKDKYDGGWTLPQVPPSAAVSDDSVPDASSPAACRKPDDL